MGNELDLASINQLHEPLGAQLPSRRSYQAIAEAYGVSRGLVGLIMKGLAWSWLTGITPKAKASPPKSPDPHPDEALVWQHWRGGQTPPAE
jgi:hypothetical protein